VPLDWHEQNAPMRLGIIRLSFGKAAKSNSFVSLLLSIFLRLKMDAKIFICAMYGD